MNYKLGISYYSIYADLSYYSRKKLNFLCYRYINYIMSHNTIVCNAACWAYLDNMLNGRPADASSCCAECRINMGQWFSTNVADQKSKTVQRAQQEDQWIRVPDEPDIRLNSEQNHAKQQKISVQYAGPVEFVAGNKKLVSYYSQITNAYNVLHNGRWVHIPEERVKQQYSSNMACIVLD